jgi:hypothetical protein
MKKKNLLRLFAIQSICDSHNLLTSSLLSPRVGGAFIPFFALSGGSIDDCGNDNNEIPFREHGYRSNPFSWKELHQIIVQEKNLEKLSRSIPVEQSYQRSLEDLKKEWKSIKDFILHSKFGLPKVLDESLHQYYVPIQEVKLASPILNVVPNDFPYFCEPGIEHWVLWKLGSEKITLHEIDSAKASIHCIEEYLIDDEVMFICWENPSRLKSLPEIEHVHILFSKF